MTNVDYVKGQVGFGADDDTISGAFFEYGLNGSDNITLENLVLLKRVIIRVKKTLLSTADTQREGFATKYDREAISKEIKEMEAEIDGATTSRPTITAINAWGRKAKRY